MPKGKKKLPFTPEDLTKVEAMAGIGLNMTQIAHVMGMSKATLERRMNDSPTHMAAKEALERGRAKAINQVAACAFRMATSGKESGMTQFWLQARANWRKTTDVDVRVETRMAVIEKFGGGETILQSEILPLTDGETLEHET